MFLGCLPKIGNLQFKPWILLFRKTFRNIKSRIIARTRMWYQRLRILLAQGQIFMRNDEASVFQFLGFLYLNREDWNGVSESVREDEVWSVSEWWKRCECVLSCVKILEQVPRSTLFHHHFYNNAHHRSRPYTCYHVITVIMSAWELHHTSHSHHCHFSLYVCWSNFRWAHHRWF